MTGVVTGVVTGLVIGVVTGEVEGVTEVVVDMPVWGWVVVEADALCPLDTRTYARAPEPSTRSTATTATRAAHGLRGFF